MPEIKIVFGKILKNHRRRNQLTQENMAKALNVSRVSVANYEAGSQSPPLEQIIRLSIILDFDLNEIKREFLQNKASNILLNLDDKTQKKLSNIFKVNLNKK